MYMAHVKKEKFRSRAERGKGVAQQIQKRQENIQFCLMGCATQRCAWLRFPALFWSLAHIFKLAASPQQSAAHLLFAPSKMNFFAVDWCVLFILFFFVFERFSCGLFCSSMHVYVLLQITLFVASMRIKIFIKLKRVEGRRINQSCVVSGCVSSKSSGTHHSSVLVLAPLRH